MERCCAPVRDVVELLRDGMVDDHERCALLDALGHYPDCVDPDHHRKVWQAEHERAERAEDKAERWNRWWTQIGKSLSDRAERAERELEVSREQARELFLQKQRAEARNARLRERLQTWCKLLEAGPGRYITPANIRAALSADADADAENSSASGRVSTGDAEPSRAEGDSLPMGMRSAVGGTKRGHEGTSTGLPKPPRNRDVRW